VWRTLAEGGAALCFVADDRPGLLSAIAAALVSHRLDVITALAFSRTMPDSGGRTSEAVDLVWVRRANAGDKEAIDEEEAASIAQVLCALLSGTISVEEIASHASATTARSAADDVVVRCEAGEADGLAVLVVEASDRPGMLLAITLEIFQAGGQIARSLVRTSGGRAFNRFELAEFNGSPLSAERCEQIRSAVFAALSFKTAPEGQPGSP
jgi:formyltetrahydrofolate hydrolase